MTKTKEPTSPSATLKADSIPGLLPDHHGATSFPIEPYVSDTYFDVVREAIFRQNWLCIGRVEEIIGPSGAFVKEIPTFKSRLVVKHDKNGELQAFHAKPGQRNQELKAVNIQTWRGFMFVNFSDDPAKTLEDALDEIGRRLQSYPFEKCTLRNRFTITLRCNWMVAIDTFQEAYHAGFLHGKWSNGNPRARILGYFFYDRNRTTTMSAPGRNPPTPVQAEAMKHGKSGLYASAETVTLDSVNPGRHPEFLVDSNMVFPNMFFNVTSRNFWTYRFWPLSHNETTYEVTLHDAPPQNYAEAIAVSYSRKRVLTMLLEDLSLMERMQTGLESGAIRQVILGEGEAMLKHAYTVTDQAVRAWVGEN